MKPGDAPRFCANELGRFLARPGGAEAFSPIEGPGLVVLDLVETKEEDARTWCAALLDQLATLPCITVAVVAETDVDADEAESRRTLSEACDVVLASTDDFDVFRGGFAHTPIAGLAYAQHLRGTPRGSIHQGLLAESFVYSTLQSGSEFASWLGANEGRSRDGKRKNARVADEGPACRFERDGDRLTITLCRPAKHNAFSREMRDALVEGLQLAQMDSAVQEIVLCGEGDSFCSGGDLDEFGSAANPGQAHVVRTTRSPAFWMSALAGRIRSEVHGACLGAGIELPAFGDRIVAEDDAFFQLPEISLGLIPGAGGTVSLPRRIGRQRTAWLGLSGQRIDAQTALAWGLIDEIKLGQHESRR